MKTHFWAPLYATLAVLPDMRRRGQGRIVNISSIGGQKKRPHLVPYSASKFALVGLSAAYAPSWRRTASSSHDLPGLMRTGTRAMLLSRPAPRGVCLVQHQRFASLNFDAG